MILRTHQESQTPTRDPGGWTTSTAIWGAVFGAVGTMIVGFSWMGWTLGHTTTRLVAEGSQSAVVAALTPGSMNPHQSHLGEVPCVDCHAGHEKSVSQCTQCKHKKT